jgi:hypothetical protein
LSLLKKKKWLIRVLMVLLVLPLAQETELYNSPLFFNF